MMKHYSENELGESFDKHPVVEAISEVENAFEEIGKPVNLAELVLPIPGSEPAEKGLLLTPDFSESVEELLDNVGWLSVNKQIAESFGEVKGSAEMTNVFIREDLTTSDMIEFLNNAEYSSEDSTDMLTKVIHAVQLVVQEKDPEPLTIVAYDLFRKSLGWKAEKFLSQTEDFHKQLASMDDMGIDLGTNKSSPWDAGNKQGFQLKTMQRVTSQNLHNEEHEIPHLSYAWTENGIHVCEMEDRRGDDKQAKEIQARANLRSKTIVKKSEEVGETKDYGRPARVIAW